MNWQSLLYLISYLVSMITSMGISIYAWRRRRTIGAFPFALVALTQAVWTLGYVFELASPSLEAKIFWDNLQWVGAFVWPMVFLAFALQYTGRKLVHPKRTWGLLASTPIIALLLIFTNDLHGLIWPTAWLVPGEPFPALVYDFSLFVWGMVIYAYGLVLSGLFILIGHFIRVQPLYRAQIGVILTGTLIPLVGTVLTLMGMVPTLHRDITPFTFALSNLIVAWGLFRYRLFDIVPVARDTIIESMRDAVIVLDAQSRLVDLNPAAQEVIGYPASAVIGQPAAQVLANWPNLVEYCQGIEEAHPEIVVGAGQDERYFAASLSSLRDRHNRFAGCLITLRDITKRKRTEEALRQAEERVRTFIESVDDMVYFQGLDGTLSMLNAANAKITGYSLEEFAANPQLWRDTVHPDDLKITEKFFADYPNGIPSFEVEYRLRMKSGEWRWIQSRMVGVKDASGRYVGYNCIDRDITEHKQVEEALRESEERYRSLFEGAEDHIFVVDQEFRYVTVNPSALKAGSFTLADVVGKGPRELFPQDAEFYISKYHHAFETGDPVRFERELRLPDGSHYFSVTLSPIKDAQGGVTALTGISQDITERKRAEAIQEERLQFEALLSELSATFVNLPVSDVDEEIERWLRRITEFLGVDRSSLIQFSEGQELMITYTHTLPGIPSPRDLNLSEQFPQYTEPLHQGKAIVLERLPDVLPPNVTEVQQYGLHKLPKSHLAIPLKVGGIMVWGAIALSTYQAERTWSDDLAQWLRLVGEVLANALVRQRTEMALNRYAGRLLALHELEQAILAAESPEAIARTGLDCLRGLVPCMRTHVLEIAPNTGIATLLAAQANGIYEEPAGPEIRLPTSSLDELKQGHVQILTDTMPFPPDSVAYSMMMEAGGQTWAIVPLLTQKQLIGILNLEIAEPDALTAEDLEVIQEVADSLSVALRQARLYAQTQEDARIKADLLREVNHRVGNNLMAIIGLMQAESHYAPPESHAVIEATLERLIQRVEGLAEVHRMLSRSQWAPVHLNDLTDQIVQVTLNALPPDQTIEVDITPSPVTVSPRQAGNLALIINELTTNTVKYAMAGRATGYIAVHISAENGMIRFEYQDDGPGYPDAVLCLEEHDVGLYLIQQLTRSLRGTLTLSNDNGAVTAITFKTTEERKEPMS